MMTQCVKSWYDKWVPLASSWSWKFHISLFMKGSMTTDYSRIVSWTMRSTKAGHMNQLGYCLILSLSFHILQWYCVWISIQQFLMPCVRIVHCFCLSNNMSQDFQSNNTLCCFAVITIYSKLTETQKKIKTETQ